MHNLEQLRTLLHKIDGRGYKAYKDIRGIYKCEKYTLYIDHVQGDPFASPSRLRIRVSQEIAGFPADTFRNKSREIALRDFVTRLFAKASEKYSVGKGTGKSGIISIDKPGQEILNRTSVFITGDYLESRFIMGLPAFGRRVASKNAEAMFFEYIPKIIDASMIYKNIDTIKLYRHVETSEDADFLRNFLQNQNLVAFVANGAVLPRKSGIHQRPLEGGRVIPFSSPVSLRVSVNLPNVGEIVGMGIPAGISLVVGGGYHGKSTLLNAIEQGIYNHIPGDGREFVITAYGAVKIRAEDGRRIEKTCITPFISNLPFGQDTNAFSSDDASGSTSQAANIIEAMEAGCRVILIDEDTSATNFMIRDHRMQELVSRDLEPITPFIDKVRQLFEEHGISSILVIGGSGDYFDVADRVICMMEYKPEEVTASAFDIARKYQTARKKEGGGSFGPVIKRIPIADSFDPGKGKREVKISAKGLKSIMFGKYSIDLGSVEQLTDVSQTRAVGEAINYALRYMDGKRTLQDVIDNVLRDIEKEGLDILSPFPAGDLAAFRGIELAAAINRLRTFVAKQKNPPAQP